MSIVNHSRETALVALASLLVACTATGPLPLDPPAQTSPSIASPEVAAQATDEQIAMAERSDPLTRATFWSREYQKTPADLDVAVSFLKALRAIESHDRMADIGRSTLAIHPQAYEIYLEMGRSLMDQGQPADAVPILARSADFAPANQAAPLAALGLAFDQLEMHDRAQEAYQIALERDPQRATTWTNYGLSLAFTGDLDGAERALRRAIDLPGATNQVRQNLVLILGLQGKTEDIWEIDPFAPPTLLRSNLETLNAMRPAAPGGATPQRPDTIGQSASAPPPTASGPQPRLTLRPKLRLGDEG